MFRVYRAKNKKNGKCYIGITSRSISARWEEHLSRARCGQRNSRLYEAIRKYGADQFEIEEIESAESESLVRELECKQIALHDSYSNGYNCNLGGHGFLVFPEHIRRKISESQKGKIVSMGTRKKMALAKQGDRRCASNFGNHTKKGSDNPRARTHLFELPNGTQQVITGLRAFCREKGLHLAHLSTRGHSKGFKLLRTFND